MSQEESAVKKITISEVLSLLDEGKSRKEIAEHYGRTQSEMNAVVWSHPKLKGRKAKKQYEGFELEDDAPDAPVYGTGAAKPTAEENTEETAEQQPEEVAQGPGEIAENVVAEQEAVAEAAATGKMTSAPAEEWK